MIPLVISFPYGLLRRKKALLFPFPGEVIKGDSTFHIPVTSKQTCALPRRPEERAVRPAKPGLPLPQRHLRWPSNASRAHRADTPTAATVPEAHRELEHRRPGCSARSATLRTEHAHTPNTEGRAGQ